jgi:uncharacterized protein YkwD
MEARKSMKWLWRAFIILSIAFFILWGLTYADRETKSVELEPIEESGVELKDLNIESEQDQGQQKAQFPHETSKQKEAGPNHQPSLTHSALNRSVSIGMTQEELEQEWGTPDRKEPSAYGYQWWIYRDQWHHYVQVGLREGIVNTVYTNALGWEWQGWKMGMPYEEWIKVRQPEEEVSFSHQLGYYTFVLDEQEQKERPLFLIEETVAVQLYIDVPDRGKIAGIRAMDLETLLVQQPYTIRYIGSLPSPPERNDQEWDGIQAAYEQQIFELVNVTRANMNLKPFLWHSQVAEVARGHSADMAQNNYFDHYSPRYGDLGQRLNTEGISFIKAGENIAWNYVDAADVHHGWMNSPGHRRNIVEPAFTHLGVGVVDKYYTQNFVQEPVP